jgi:hypothetical protein
MPTAEMPFVTATLYVPLPVPAAVNPAASALFHTTSDVPLDQFEVVVSQLPLPALPAAVWLKPGSQFSVVTVASALETPKPVKSSAAAPAERMVILRRDLDVTEIMSLTPEKREPNKTN